MSHDDQGPSGAVTSPSHPIGQDAAMKATTTSPSPPTPTAAAGDGASEATPRLATEPPRRRFRRRPRSQGPEPAENGRERTRVVDPVDIPPNDPLLVYLTSARRPVAVEDVELDSPAVERMREAGVSMLVPLVANGQLVGVIQLGERLSEQDYAADDRRLLELLASQAAPALRVGQLVQEQEVEIRRRERYEQELHVAQLIQQRFLPGDLPEPPGWRIHPYYRAAREVGGDFYDVLDLPGGKLGLVIGDVTDKGVPAALVMASTRSVLRAAAQRLVDPAKVLTRVNDELVKDIPARMFVTCFYGVLDPHTGVFEFANAGHDLPFLTRGDEIVEAEARGMPLGMLPGSTYQNAVVELEPGARLLLYSDGICEAHRADGEMFGFERTGELLHDLPRGADAVDAMLARLADFTGPDWEQEDDVTVLLVERSSDEHSPAGPHHLSAFRLPSREGGEREAIRRVTEALGDVDLPEDRREALATAVGEAVMNAMEHAHGNDPTLEVEIEVMVAPDRVSVAITDQGGGDGFIDGADEPDLDAKLRGEQTPRGWGLFLVRSLVDQVHETGDDRQHTITLEMFVGGAS